MFLKRWPFEIHTAEYIVWRQKLVEHLEHYQPEI